MAPRPRARKKLPPALTPDELRARPTISVDEYAATIDVSRDCVYEAAARGELKVLRLGRRVKVPTAPLLAALGLATPQGGEPSD